MKKLLPIFIFITVTLSTLFIPERAKCAEVLYFPVVTKIYVPNSSLSGTNSVVYKLRIVRVRSLSHLKVLESQHPLSAKIFNISESR